MSSRLWLLVEWVDESGSFPHYGIVNVGSLIGSVTKLHMGKLIIVRDKHVDRTRRAKILRMSESKKSIKEQKEVIEREDYRMKNVLNYCIAKFREMESSSVQYPGIPSTSGRTSTLPQVVADTDTSSVSDDESVLSFADRRRRNTSNSSRFKRSPFGQSSRHQTPYKRQRPAARSTPMSTVSGDYSLTPAVNHDTQIEQPDGKHDERFVQVESISESLKNKQQVILKFLANPRVVNVLREIVRNNGNVEEAARTATESEQSASTNELLVADGQPPEISETRRMSTRTTRGTESSYSPGEDVVHIGSGKTEIPARVYNDIDWNSYSSATRHLLQAVFPRSVLATHSLTGKKSPAFTDKPAKKRLDPIIVNDIVDTVSELCGVSKGLVRNTITVKCTDEAKLYRNRQQYNNARLSSQNQQQVSSPGPSPDNVPMK